MLTIPKIIHQTWSNTDIPSEFRNYQVSWQQNHPDWEYRLWTDEDNRRLLKQDYPWLLDIYDAYPYPIQRVDMARCLYLHKFGGLYADMDFECLKPVETLFNAGNIFLGRENHGMGYHCRGQDFICNAFMASETEHPFWTRLLFAMKRAFRPKRMLETKIAYILTTTGPKMLDIEIGKYSRHHDDVMIFPQDYFYPVPLPEYRPAIQRAIALQRNAYAVHHFAGTWVSPIFHLRQVIRTHLSVRQ